MHGRRYAQCHEQKEILVSIHADLRWTRGRLAVAPTKKRCSVSFLSWDASSSFGGETPILSNAGPRMTVETFTDLAVNNQF
jgi:hypothetical protein